MCYSTNCIYGFRIFYNSKKFKITYNILEKKYLKMVLLKPF